MDEKSIQLVGRFLQLVLIVLTCSCTTTKKEIIPYNQSQSQQKVNVTLNVGKNANFEFNVSTDDAIALRTFLMQGFELTFKGEYTYSIKIPSAKDVEGSISHHPGEVKATMQGDSEKRPDVRPLLEALNKEDVFIYLKEKKAGKVKSFKASIEPATGELTYDIILPNIYSMDLPISVTLTSSQTIKDDEFTNGQFANRNKSERPQPFGVGQVAADQRQRNITLNFQFNKPANSTLPQREQQR